jgi:hypothetical protein
MKTESIKMKCGAFGMYCILGSLTIGFLGSFLALIATVVCIVECIL